MAYIWIRVSFVTLAVLVDPLNEANNALRRWRLEELTTSPNTAEFREKHPEVAEYGGQLQRADSR